ncbi:Uma2 family endonuclease [Rubrivirga sp.]|uniref:Uma2 family endonuclease n=1 Tax=Rubrivirga sp. TaxID=1885344 RepID=UPI003B52C6D0
MPVAAARTITFTPEEYFDWEERQEERHEYSRGEVYPTPGGTYEHFLIVSNVVGTLRLALGDAGAVLPDGMRVQIHELRYVYPDTSVVLGEPAFREGSKRRVLLNPSVVVEVLSESTATYDRGETFALYREVASLREIVWVDSERRFVEVATKSDGTWALPSPVEDGRVELPSLGVTVAVDDLYRGVTLG